MIFASIQISVVFLVVWLTFRLVPSIPANTRSWIWRLAFLKPIVALLPFAALTLHILPTKSSSALVQTSTAQLHGATVTALASHPSQAFILGAIDPWLVLWLTGSGAFLMMGVLNSLRIESLTRRAKQIDDPTIQMVGADLLRAAGVKNPVAILHTNEVATPLLVGFRKPTILLPTSALSAESKDDVRLMLAHEIAHLARRDSSWFVYFWTVQTLLFFNPVVWFATRCARLDHESATDEYASQLADVPVQTYAEMLLRATVVTRGLLAPGTAPMSESYRSIHRRLEAMKHFKTPSTPMRKTATIALAFAVVGLLPLYQFAEASSEGTQDVKPASQVAVRSVDNAPVKVVQGRPASPLAPSAQPRPGDAAPIVVPGHPLASRSVDSRPAVAPVPARPQKDKVLWRVVDVYKIDGSAPAAKTSMRTDKDKPQARVVDVQKIDGSAPNPKPSKRTDAVLIEGRPMAPKGAKGHDLVRPGVAIAPAPAPAEAAPAAHPAKDVFSPAQPADSIARPDRLYEVAVPMALSSKSAPAKDAFKSDEPQTFTIEMNGAQIEEAIRLLCKSAKKEYVIDSHVKGTVNVILKEATFEVAIEALANSVQATYKIENGVYRIVPK